MSMKFSGTIYDQIQDLEKRVSNLERQLNLDERTRKLGPNDDSKAGIKCRTCGIIFEQGVFGYVCQNSHCPSKIRMFSS